MVNLREQLNWVCIALVICTAHFGAYLPWDKKANGHLVQQRQAGLGR